MFHLYSISIHNVVTMSMQNRWTVCSSAHSESFPPSSGQQLAGRPVFFFLSSSRHSQLLWLQTSPGLSPMTAHLGPRRGGQTGRCPPCRPWRKGELTWGVFTLSSREVEAAEGWTEQGGGKWDRRGGRGVLWGHFSWREKRKGEGSAGRSRRRSKGGARTHTGHWTLNLYYRYFHPSDVSHRFGSHAADITLRDQLLYPTRGTLFDYTGLTF